VTHDPECNELCDDVSHWLLGWKPDPSGCRYGLCVHGSMVHERNEHGAWICWVPGCDCFGGAS